MSVLKKEGHELRHCTLRTLEETWKKADQTSPGMRRAPGQREGNGSYSHKSGWRGEYIGVGLRELPVCLISCNADEQICTLSGEK